MTNTDRRNVTNASMNYRCLGCLRVVEKFEEVEGLNQFLNLKENKWIETKEVIKRCPICKHQAMGALSKYEVEAPLSPIPHCPYCKKVVATLKASRTMIIEGGLSVGMSNDVYYPDEYSIYDDCFGESEGSIGDPRNWKLTCPHCEARIANPENCLKPYAI